MRRVTRWAIGGLWDVRSASAQHIPAPLCDPQALIAASFFPPINRRSASLNIASLDPIPTCSILLRLQLGPHRTPYNGENSHLRVLRRRLPVHTSQYSLKKRTSITTYLYLALAVAVAVQYIPVTGSAGGWEELYSTWRLPESRMGASSSYSGNHTDRLRLLHPTAHLMLLVGYLSHSAAAVSKGRLSSLLRSCSPALTPCFICLSANMTTSLRLSPYAGVRRQFLTGVGPTDQSGHMTSIFLQL